MEKNKQNKKGRTLVRINSSNDKSYLSTSQLILKIIEQSSANISWSSSMKMVNTEDSFGST